MRLDQYLATTNQEYSRSTWQKYIKRGFVTVNNSPETSPKREVSSTDTIIATVPNEPDFSDHQLPIIYEDDDVLVVDKPIGILTHQKGALKEEFSVAEFIAPRLAPSLRASDRGGIVHRLDRATSGVMITAKNESAYLFLSQQFKDRQAKKTYLAILCGIPKELHARIDLPIERHPKKPYSFRVGASGKSASTEYTVTHISPDETRCLAELRPQTGRTHQLRIHMAYLGAPLLGDILYGGEATDRLYLHAWQLEVMLPSGQKKTFVSPPPADFMLRSQPFIAIETASQ